MNPAPCTMDLHLLDYRVALVLRIEGHANIGAQASGWRWGKLLISLWLKVAEAWAQIKLHLEDSHHLPGSKMLPTLVDTLARMVLVPGSCYNPISCEHYWWLLHVADPDNRQNPAKLMMGTPRQWLPVHIFVCTPKWLSRHLGLAVPCWWAAVANGHCISWCR